MNFYEAKIEYETGDNYFAISKESENIRKEWSGKLMDANRDMGAKCGLDGKLSIYLCGGKDGNLEVIMACAMEKVTWKECLDWISDYFKTHYNVAGLRIKDDQEISAERFNRIGERTYNQGYLRNWRNEAEELEIDYFNNCQYKISEYVIPGKSVSYKKSMAEAEKLMADETLKEELGRIYSSDNEHKYYGNPVHYKITATNSDAAIDMVHLMVKALYSNKRLLSKRIGRIYNISDNCFREEDVKHIFKCAQGGAVVIELAGSDEGNYASSYQEVIDFFSDMVNRYHLNTLCFFIEDTNHPGFSKNLISMLQDEIDIIEIKEGYGNKESALKYLKGLMDKSDSQPTEEEMKQALGDKNMFSVSEIYTIYQQWFITGLRERIYKAYKSCTTYKVDFDSRTSEPQKELSRMVGLEEVKQLVGEIIDSSKVQMMRERLGLESGKTSKHMLFTGNPGSAKTTVARLLAEILRKEGVLDTGTFIECGRADLVGKYVGWTAPTIKAKFRRAKGGILFIDEAYSLVSDDGYGDEAITTIVQEMENHRDDVIVIFAGYPDKMDKFLDKNEGLRSRIAFHLDFPDYTPDEMTDILKLMIEKNGYCTDEAALDKCHKIFENACAQKEFGNGRFARNLLEQAELAQSKRIMSESKGKQVSRKKLQTLKAEDFDVNLTKNVKGAKRTIGFVS